MEAALGSTGMASGNSTLDSTSTRHPFEDASMPSSLSSTLVFSPNPKIDSSRRAAFDKFIATVSSLSQEQGHTCSPTFRIVSNAIAKQLEGPDCVHVNSLVFQVSDDACPILLIVPTTEKVDIAKVQDFLTRNPNGENVVTVKLAPAKLVEAACGFPPGSVPPMGHSPVPLKTLVDERLKSIRVLWGGGGHSKQSCLVETETLLNLDHVLTADIVQESSLDDSKARVNDNGPSSIMNVAVVNGVTHPAPMQMTSKPFFPVAPPPRLASTSPLVVEPTTPVTVIGRLTCVRQVARRLVFADLAPPDDLEHPQFDGSLGETNDERPWKSGLDGMDMAVQLIAGKTLCEALGDVAGPAALRRLKPGQLVLVRGKTNVGNADSLRNWMEKRSLDIIVSSYQLLEEARPLKNGVGNVERKRQQTPPNLHVAPVLQGPLLAVPKPTDDSVGYLGLNDVFKSPKDEKLVTVVDSLESVNEFAIQISQLLLFLTTSRTKNDDDRNVDADTSVLNVPGLNKVGLIGMDCEWRPSFMSNFPNEPQPVMLLQISVHSLKRVFLFDTQALFRPLQEPTEPMTALEASASQTLQDVFSSQRLVKVGFQLGADLRKLASSYPHIPAFRTFEAVVEVASLAKKAMQLKKERNIKHHTASLARVCEFFVGKTVNKEQQVSDWAMRPLSENQIDYAALDAAVSPLLLEKSLQRAEAGIITDGNSRASSSLQLGRWEDDVMFTGSVLSWRFFLLDTNDPNAIRKLKAKRIVGDPYIVTQRWHTGGKPPMRPSAPRDNTDGPYTDVSGVFRLPSKLVRITAGKDPSTLVDCIVGERVGRCKDNCIKSLLTGEAALPDRAKVDFHQRSGYVEFADGVALFVNMPSRLNKRGYPNEWLKDGKVLTWYLRKNEWENGTSSLAQKLVRPSYRQELEGGSVFTPPAVPVLFVRMAKGVFLCCGRCFAIAGEIQEPKRETVDGVSKVGDWGLIQLHLELVDWEKLQLSTEFVAMVDGWLGHSRESPDESNDADAVQDSSPRGNEFTENKTLAQRVLNGDFVGALSLALNEASVPSEKRSIKQGLKLLMTALANDASNEAARARKVLHSRSDVIE